MTKPLTFDQLTRRVAAGAAILAVCLVALVVYLSDGAVPVTADVATAARPPLATMPPAAPPAPPCMHEVCGERPARLRCIHGNIIPERCDVYAFEYEHHCTCDAWGTVATDGGAP